jgi:hypothetical protein
MVVKQTIRNFDAGIDVPAPYEVLEQAWRKTFRRRRACTGPLRLPRDPLTLCCRYPDRRCDNPRPHAEGDEKRSRADGSSVGNRKLTAKLLRASLFPLPSAATTALASLINAFDLRALNTRISEEDEWLHCEHLTDRQSKLSAGEKKTDSIRAEPRPGSDNPLGHTRACVRRGQIEAVSECPPRDSGA